MKLSIQQLRDEFKTHLDKWEAISHQNPDAPLRLEIQKEVQKWGNHLEKFIQEKVQLLEMDFNEYSIEGEYLRSVSEGFDDLERIMRTHKTLIDILDISKNYEFPQLLQQIK